jgi:predicted permease
MGALRSVRYTLRQFRLSPIFTATAILTLAIGIGGTTAMFGLMHAVMLRSLPVSDPASLYRIGDGSDCCVQGGPQDRWGIFSYPLYERLIASTPEFDSTTAFQAGRGRLSVRREGVDVAARPLRSEYVTGSYFSTLGVGAFGGRVFNAQDDRPGAPPVAVLSYHAWQLRYGGDRTVVGSTFAIENQPFTIVGITPPGFFGETLQSDPPEIWIPLQQEPTVAGANSLLRQGVSAWLRAIGRLKPGATTAGMAPRLTSILREWLRHDSGYPPDFMPDVIRGLPRQTISIVPAGAGVGIMKEAYGRSLQILLAVCGLVLLIACANVANLLLARAAARRSQTAVRLAVGATRRQIVGQALGESLVLAIAGGIAGLLVAKGAARLLLSLAFSNATFLPIDTGPSFVVLAFAFGLAVLTGLLFGAAPAWMATRTDPVDALRGSGRGNTGHGSRWRQALLVLQAALSVVLVAGATMLGRSLGNLEHQDLGYQARGRVVVSLDTPPASYTEPQLASLYREIEDRLTHLPGVSGAGLALYNPLTDNWGEMVLVQGHPAPKMSDESGASWDRISAGYLRNFGVPIIRGRGITPADNETAAPVAVVNQAFARRFFKSSEDPLGQHFGMDLPEEAGTFRIVGIAGDAKFAGFGLNRPARPMFYLPLAQSVSYANPLMAKLELRSHFIDGLMLVTNLAPDALEPLLRKTLGSIDPNLTIVSVRTMTQQVALTFDQERAVAGLAGLFGVIALLLAGIGLYGVTACGVAQRTNEIGIRMALGAGRPSVVGMILRGAFALVAIGLVVGIPLAIGAGRLITAQLYGVTFWDPLAFAVAGGALALCAFIAAAIPAARAASVPPTQALRAE